VVGFKCLICTSWWPRRGYKEVFSKQFIHSSEQKRLTRTLRINILLIISYTIFYRQQITFKCFCIQYVNEVPADIQTTTMMDLPGVSNQNSYQYNCNDLYQYMIATTFRTVFPNSVSGYAIFRHQLEQPTGIGCLNVSRVHFSRGEVLQIYVAHIYIDVIKLCLIYIYAGFYLNNSNPLEFFNI